MVVNPSSVIIKSGWTSKISGETVSTHMARNSNMRQFLKFAADNGYRVTVPVRVKYNRSTYVPYIFTEDEIRKFFQVCDNVLIHYPYLLSPEISIDLSFLDTPHQFYF